jgi:predicted transcriptional regulator of viral defense system
MYENFRRNFENFIVISSKEIEKVYPHFDAKNLINWQKKDYLIKLRNKYYLLAENKITEEKLYNIANKIYYPSYVSMESALNYHNIIPEGVYSIQSVTTRKTNSFTTKVGIFNYQTIKKELYFGYLLIKNNNFRMASKEKAILDFLYLRTDISDYESFEALRWNKDILKNLNNTLLSDYLNLYNSPTLNQKIKFLQQYTNA